MGWWGIDEMKLVRIIDSEHGYVGIQDTILPAFVYVCNVLQEKGTQNVFTDLLNSLSFSLFCGNHSFSLPASFTPLTTGG